MRCLRVLVMPLALGASLALVACGAQPTTAMCFGPRPVASVHAERNDITFSMTTKFGIQTYSVPRSAFGGAPTAMKNGDLVSFCTETVEVGGRSTTTITQFSDQGQPATTDTPQSR